MKTPPKDKPHLYVREGKRPWDELWEAFTLTVDGRKEFHLRTCRPQLIIQYAKANGFVPVRVRNKRRVACPSK